MQARVRFGFVRRGATLCGDRACRLCSATSVELEAENWRLFSTTLVRGVSGELEDENWRLSSTTLYEEYLGSWKMRTDWRLCSTTVVRGAICGAGS